MNTNSSNRKDDPRLFETIRSDFKQEDFFKKARREFRDLKEFYIDSEKKQRLNQMNPVKRIFFIVWWILRSMILKLNPLRRILLLVGIVLILAGKIIIKDEQGGNTSSDNWFGVAVILIVLMLELKDKLLAHDELDAGRKIQEALRPEQSPKVEGWSLWLFTRSANEVGGDLIDYIRISEDRVAAVIADVAGKGLKAALLTAKLQAMVRTVAYDCNSITELITKVNEIFHRDSLRSMFASMLYVEITPGTGNLSYTNAGHLPPLFVSAEKIIELPKGETALGLLKSGVYTLQNFYLNSGDIFVAFSDGLIEARSEYGTFFSLEKFYEILKSTKHLPVNEIGQRIVSTIDAFILDAPIYDDLSIIILKRD